MRAVAGEAGPVKTGAADGVAIMLCASSKVRASRRCRDGSPCPPKSFAANGRQPACASCGELDGPAQRLANGLDSVGPHHDECKDGKFETGMSRVRGFLR